MTDPVQDHPTMPRSGKRKVKCVKALGRYFTLKFGEGLNMGEVVTMVSKVLVGRVRGCA